MGRIFGARTGLFSIAVPLFLAAFAFPAETIVYSYTAEEAPTVSDESGEAVFATTLFSTVTGQPRLPMVMKSFLVPIDAEVGSISARMTDIHEEFLGGTYEVRPVPPMASGKGVLLWPKDRIFVAGRDVGVYGADAFFPEEKHIEAKVSQQGEWKFVDCAIAPYRYNPVTRKLTKVVSAQFEVKYARTSGLSAQSARALPQRRNSLDRDFRKIGKGFVNYSEAKGSYLSAGAVDAGGGPSGARISPSGAVFQAANQAAGLVVTGRYVILTTAAMQSALTSGGLTGLSAFVSQKQAQGFSVQMVTETQWGGGTGDVAAKRIRQWLRANYLALNIQYVLLIGNPHPLTGNVPMMGAYPDGVEMVPTDFYYSELSGNWDINNNGKSGEAEDFILAGGPDAFAEVSVGRIPFYESYPDCDRILKRTVAYQNTTASKALERRMVLLPMVPLDASTPSYQLGEQIREDFSAPNGWRQHRIYDTVVYDNNGMPIPLPEVKAIVPAVEMLDVSPAKVVTAWNTIAQGLTIWMTHGSGTGAAKIMEYEHTGLLSDNAPGIVLHGSCSNAEPEIAINLSYMLLKSGAIASIAGTRVSWYTPGWNDFRDQNSDGGIAYHFAKQVIRNGLPVSDAFNAVRSTIVTPNWWNWIVFNTYGAPELTLNTAYTGPKFDISRDKVEFGEVSVADQTQIRTVVLENSGTTPMSVTSIASDNALFVPSGVAFPGNLAAGQKATLSIRFNPGAIGYFNGTITVRTSLGDKTIGCSAGALPAGEYLHLTDYPWGSDILDGYYTWKQDRGTEGFPMSIGDKGYDRGIGGHSASGSESYVTYDLRTMGRKINSFYAEVGIDDRLTEPTCGSAIFKVYLDNVLAYASPFLDTDSPLLPISVAVGNASILKLALNDGGDGGCGDHGDWGNTRLYVAANMPPTAAIMVPVANAVFPSGSNIAITATAGDPDGVIAKVEFFRGAVKIGEDASSPYQSIYVNAAAGSHALTVKATDNKGAVFTSAAVAITVSPQIAIGLPGRIQTEDYKAGGEGVGYHDLGSGNAGGAYTRNDNVDIEATTDVGGGYNVGWIDGGEWLAYDVNVGTAGAYNLTARIASGVSGNKTVGVTVDGVAVGTFTTSDASGWQSWKDVTLAGINFTAGNHGIRLTMNTGGINLNYVDVQPQVVAPELLINGNFTNGLASWQTYFTSAGLGTIANEANSARVTINNPGANVYDIQIFQPVSLIAGRTYTLSFDMKAEATPKSFRAMVERNSIPWTKYQDIGYTVTAAANSYQHYVLTWTQPVTDAGARIVFNFGLTNAFDAWLDNASLK